VSSAARRHGVAPNLLYRSRRLLSKGGAAAVEVDESVVGNREVKKLEDGVRELKCMLGLKTMEAEIVLDAFPKQSQKADIVADGRFPMKYLAATPSVFRSNLIERLKDRSKPSSSYNKAEDAELLPIIRRLVDQRSTYGYRRIAAPQ
jgi:hypothetical protein